MIPIWLLGIAMAQEASLAGTFGLLQTAVSAAKVPVFGEVKSVMLTWSLVTISAEGTQRQEICAFEMQGRSMFFKTKVPPGYAKTLPVRTQRPTFVQEGGTWRYEVDLGLLPVGYDPTLGYLPSTLEDPAVIDSDNDGKPGATVQVEVRLFGTVDVYVVQMTHVTLRGTVQDADHIAGAMVIDAVEQHVLDASNRLFVMNPKIRPIQEESTFRMQRLPDGSTCANVQEALSE